MKNGRKYIPFLFLTAVLLLLPATASAQTPGDGDCPVCFADPDDLDYTWCNTWQVGMDWCASVAGVCTHGSDSGEPCSPEMAALTIDGADASEHQVDWNGFPLASFGDQIQTLVADGRAHLLTCKKTVLLRAYTREVQESLRADASALTL